ncbi:MAG: Lrp/AsnC family transcriptional regulator [Dehalococcoidia bacterium]|nr:Lrp/AsnC family transcriptional regulator [Dehalococcoidia bacterium]
MSDQSIHDVLTLLEQDARITPERIAQATGRTTEDVKAIIARAEADGIILRYGALVDWERAGRTTVWAWIELKVTPEPDLGFEGVAARIARFPQTWSVYLTSGTYDLGLLIQAATMQEIANFVSQKLATLSSVQSTSTYFIMQRYKVDGTIFERPSEAGRLPVSM